MNKKDKILTLAREIPLFSTDQAATYFKDNGSPSKRASEVLKALEREKWIEGKRREMGKTKVWRLSSIGRKRLEVTRATLPFNSPKTEHVLEIGSIFQELFDSGRLRFFQYEPKDEFYAGRPMMYAPDAFFYLQGRGAFLLEVQRTPLSSSRWAQKWAVADAFFSSGSYKSASWQTAGNVKLKPSIIVITNQQEETVKAGSMVETTISKDIHFLLE